MAAPGASSLSTSSSSGQNGAAVKARQIVCSLFFSFVSFRSFRALLENGEGMIGCLTALRFDVYIMSLSPLWSSYTLNSFRPSNGHSSHLPYYIFPE